MGKKSKVARKQVKSVPVVPAKKDVAKVTVTVPSNVEETKKPLIQIPEAKKETKLAALAPTPMIPMCISVVNSPINSNKIVENTPRILTSTNKPEYAQKVMVMYEPVPLPTESLLCAGYEQTMDLSEGRRSRSCSSVGVTDNESASGDHFDKPNDPEESSGGCLMRSVLKHDDWLVEEEFIDEDGWLVVEA